MDKRPFPRQNDLSSKKYYNIMIDNIDEISSKRLMAIRDIEKEKLQVAKTYNKRVWLKDFQVANLV
jgi:hypothetical protein